MVRMIVGAILVLLAALAVGLCGLPSTAEADHIRGEHVDHCPGQVLHSHPAAVGHGTPVAGYPGPPGYVHCHLVTSPTTNIVPPPSAPVADSSSQSSPTSSSPRSSTRDGSDGAGPPPPASTCQSVYPHTYVRDGSLGQTYRVIQRNGCSYRRWVHPDSPLVYAIPWKTVNALHTVPVESILSIPLDTVQPWDSDNPSDFMLVRRFDGSDDVRIFVHQDGQWAHVLDLATFAARGYRWEDVTAADAGFWQSVVR